MDDSAGRQHSIVTGGSSGIGAAVVQELLGRGHAVTVLDLQAGDVGGVAYETLDLTDEAAVVAAVDAASARSGPATGLVVCHGIRGEFRPAVELDLARMRRVLDVHVVATLSVCREVVTRLAGRSAAIVTVSSTTAFGGWAGQSDYGTAKAAVRQLTQNLAIEWAPLGVRVNSVAPGHTLTPMVQDMVDQGYDLASVRARTPLGRLAESEEMARAICYLLCDADFVTGQCLAVDGGWTTVGK